MDHALTAEILSTLEGAGFALYGICRATETSHRAKLIATQVAQLFLRAVVWRVTPAGATITA